MRRRYVREGERGGDGQREREIGGPQESLERRGERGCNRAGESGGVPKRERERARERERERERARERERERE